MTHIFERTFAFDLRSRLALFALATSCIYAVAVSIAQNLEGFGGDAAVIAAGVTLDIALVVPVLYWLLVVRAGAPRLSIVPVSLLSLAAAGAIVPSEHHQALSTLEALALPLEVGLVGYLFWSVRRALAAGEGAVGEWDPLDRLRSAASRLLGPGRGAEILAFEATVFYFAFGSWRREVPEPGAGEVFISHHRKALYSTAFAGIMIAGAIELVPMHWLLGLWSPAAAWILTGLSIYGLIWLVGDYRAILLRPSRVARGRFFLRLGLRWQAEIPLLRIRACRKLTAGDRQALRSRRDVLRATLLGEPSHLLELDSPIEFEGPYGLRRRATSVALSLDQEQAFEAALEESRRL